MLIAVLSHLSTLPALSFHGFQSSSAVCAASVHMAAAVTALCSLLCGGLSQSDSKEAHSLATAACALAHLDRLGSRSLTSCTDSMTVLASKLQCLMSL